MTILNVLRMGNKQLSTPSIPVENFNAPEIKEIIKNMRDTMLEKNGVGIAAPQVGYNKRIIMFGFEHNPRYPNEKPVPFTILINPEIVILSNEMIDGWEGCLSVPGLRGLIPRYQHIRYSGFDTDGNQIEREASGFHARILQHECDHLDGVLFPQRIKDMRYFGFEEELAEIIANKVV